MRTFKFHNVMLPLIVILSAFSISCAKKASGVRTVRQTEANVINAAVSTPSTQAANAQNLLFQLTVIELPGEATAGTFTINAEIKTPSGKFVPITTTHTNGQDAFGVINDTDSGAKLDVRARCLGASCDTYILLLTVVKNNYSVHQVMAVSYLTDETHFNVENINASVAPASFYRSLDEVVQRNNLK